MPSREDSAASGAGRRGPRERAASWGQGPHDPIDGSRWDERIGRAHELAAKYPAAAGLLIFYAALTEYQKSLLDNSAAVEPRTRSCEPPSPPLLDSLDLEPVLAAIPDFLSWLQRMAPTRLRESAAEMHRLDRAQWRHLAHSYLGSDGRNVEDADQTRVFVLEALLQPFAEQLAIGIGNSAAAAGEARNLKPASAEDPARLAEVRDAEVSRERRRPEARSPISCLLCGALPVVGVLREEGQGAKRALVCALCLTEREYLRVVCPACGEQQFDVLPVYTADQFAHVRIEACDRCRCYLKTIDLTKDGLAVPPVDDLASVSLDLWARDRGYVRLRPNLLRI